MNNTGSFADALQDGPAPNRRTAPSRQGLKHVGAYVDPAVARQLRVIAAGEDSTTQALIIEGIERVFQSRGVEIDTSSTE